MRVPATIMTSDCLGLGRRMIPNLSKSYLDAPVSSFQPHDEPKVMAHMIPRLAQFIKSSTLDINYSATFDGPVGDPVVVDAGPTYSAGVVLAGAEDSTGGVVWRAEAPREAMRARRDGVDLNAIAMSDHRVRRF